MKLYSVVNMVETQMYKTADERMLKLSMSKSGLRLLIHALCIPTAKNTNQVYQKDVQLRFLRFSMGTEDLQLVRGEKEAGEGIS